MKYQIHLITLDVNKWSVESRKMSFTFSAIINDALKNVEVESSILKPAEMVEEFLLRLRATVVSEVADGTTEKNGEEDAIPEIEINNEGYVRQKLLNFFRKLNNEVRNNKRNHRKIHANHLDVYDESTDISFLPRNIQFHIVLNWCKRFYEREEYKKAIDPLRRLMKLNPEFGLGYKWLARSLKKVRKYDEAMRFYQKYAEVDGSIDSLLDLAKSYRKGKIFDKSEEIYHQILEQDPKNKEARIGLAQIKFALKQEDYLEILDQLYQEDPAWLKEWLVDEFNFRIYLPEKTLIPPLQAARFLGFEKVHVLTEWAFRNDLPSHFNPIKARLSFYKEELENWAKVMNRFQCLDKEIQLRPENLEEGAYHVNGADTPEEAEQPNKSAAKKKEGASTKLEEILAEIRARKAQRAAMQAEMDDTYGCQHEKAKPEAVIEDKSQTKAESENSVSRRKASSKKAEKSKI